MATIPAGGSLVATTDYYRRRIGSTSSSSSCGSSEYSGEVIPHHPGEPSYMDLFLSVNVREMVPQSGFLLLQMTAVNFMLTFFNLLIRRRSCRGLNFHERPGRRMDGSATIHPSRSQVGQKTWSLQHVLGLPGGLLPVGRAWDTSPGGILTRYLRESPAARRANSPGPLAPTIFFSHHPQLEDHQYEIFVFWLSYFTTSLQVLHRSVCQPLVPPTTCEQDPETLEVRMKTAVSDLEVFPNRTLVTGGPASSLESSQG